MKAKELNNMADSDLKEKLREDKAILAKMKFTHGVAGTENPMTIRHKRREIARINTLLNQRATSK